MPERDCQGCKRQDEWGCFAKKVREPGELEDPREAWENPATLPLGFDGEEVFACPRQNLREETAKWAVLLRYYGMYKRGFLPQQGAVMDQSNYAVEVFRILDAVNADCDKAEQEQRPKGPPGGYAPSMQGR